MPRHPIRADIRGRGSSCPSRSTKPTTTRTGIRSASSWSSEACSRARSSKPRSTSRTGDLLGEILLRNGLLSKLALASSLHEQSIVQEHESGFGSGLRGALGGAEPQEYDVARNEPETEGGFGSGLRRALEQRDD